jgi:hypothetical protein
MCRHGLETWRPKGQAWVARFCDRHSLSTFAIALLAVTIRGSVVEKDRVITRIVLGMLF